MDWCGGRTKEVSLCEYAEKCDEKVDCTSNDDWVKGIFPVYCAGFGEHKCMRDDGGIVMDGVLCTGRGIAGECKYLEKCGARTKFGIRDDRQPDALSLYCMNRVGICLRDDGDVKMSEAVREMTREELLSECAKLERECLALSDKCKARECQIKEMQSYIDCLKAELVEIQMNKSELAAKSFEIKIDSLEIPIQKVSVLIRDTQDKYQEVYGMNDGFSMAISDLKQIAEHLLVYCNHAEVE